MDCCCARAARDRAPRGAATDLPPDVTCNGDFHLVERFTKGRQTAVRHPTVAAGKLWLLQGYIDADGEWGQQLRSWDGATWTEEQVPEPQEGEYYITSLDVTDDGVAWLAGYHTTTNTQAVVLRYDGEVWETTPLPVFEPSSSLNDIDMWSSDDGWVVGVREVDGDLWTLALRWNGVAWEHVESPGRGGGSELTAVSMAAPDDVWAIKAGGQRNAIHWDGSAWSRSRLPSSKDRFLWPIDIDAVDEDRAWISGSWEKGNRSAPAILKWNGNRWSTTKTMRGSGYNWLHAVDASPGGWIVGENRTRDGVTPIVWRREGGRWRTASADNPGRGGHLDHVVNEDGIAWATGRASSKKRGLYGVLQKACI